MKRVSAFVALILGLAVAFAAVTVIPSTEAQDTTENLRPERG